MGQEHDPAIGELVEHEAMQPDDDLHVLAHGTDPAADVLLGDPVPQEWGEITARQRTATRTLPRTSMTDLKRAKNIT